MDLIFDVDEGKQFTIEIGYFDSGLEIKEKVQKYQGIPVSNQTLIFNGKVIPDDFDVHNSDLLDRSRIQLIVAASDSDTDKHVEEPPPPPPEDRKSIMIFLKLLQGDNKPVDIALEVEVTYTVRELKERIGEEEGIPVSGIEVYAKNRTELLDDDDRTLHDYQISDDSELVVRFKQQLHVAATGNAEEPPPPPPEDRKSIMIFLKLLQGENKQAGIAMEVDVTYTVRKLKEIIGEGDRIPVSGIAVYANGTEELLDDDRTLHDYQISDDSELVARFKSIIIILKMQLGADKADVSQEVNPTDTVRKLKEIIGEVNGIPASRIAVYANGIELLDEDRTLHDCQISNHSEVVVSLKPPLPATTTAAGSSRNTNRSKKLIRIMVESQCGTKKFPVEVNPSENVEVLRKEIERLKEQWQLELPEDGYFFIHKQTAIYDEDRSFRSHNVAQGDTIEMFNGRITKGG